MRPQPRQVAGKEVDVTYAAEHLLRLEPRAVGFARSVKCFQVGRPRQRQPGGRLDDLFEVIEEVVPSPVEVMQQPEQPLELRFEPDFDGPPLFRVCAGERLA